MKGILPVRRTGSCTPAKRSRDGVDREHLLDLLQRYFGHTSFRGLQLDVIEDVLSGRDCFCLMPTGAGKSICYQIPALAKPGIVLVVSPLIALMEDQVAALKSCNVAAEFLSSSQPAAVKKKIHEELDSGKPSLKVLYVTPELLSTNAFMQKLKKLHGRGLLSLVAIDEAHCISSWGHDFRPSYRKLADVRANLPDIPILALTATAGKKVQLDVMKSLKLQNPSIRLSSFNRPNIFYEVRYKDVLGNSYNDLRDTLRKAPSECCIIYCHARAKCDEIGAQLAKDGVACRVYHAGLGDKARSEALKEWASGKIPVIVATVAFGMGIDRKDVRMVCHFNMPKSLEAFYQESGRAGRDGQPARSILYYGIDDRKTMEYVIRSSFEKQKAKKKDGPVALLKKDIEAFEKVVSYCAEANCRRRKVLEYFGEQVAPSLCGKTCDACKTPTRVSNDLKELADVASTTQFGRPSVYFQSSSTSAEKSEFWSYDNDDNEQEDPEEASCSDDGEEKEAAVAAARKGGNKLEKKVDALLSAEQEFLAKQGNTDKKPGQKNVINQEFRDSTVKRLGSVLQAAVQRLGTEEIEMNKAAATLEAECFRKFGKLGRTFYNCQVASTVRWLSNCSMEER